MRGKMAKIHDIDTSTLALDQTLLADERTYQA